MSCVCVCAAWTGHVKSSLMGVSLNIPITKGRLNLGTWQGVYLNEHRNTGGWGGGHRRNIVITVQGERKATAPSGEGGGSGKKKAKKSHAEDGKTVGEGGSQ